MQTESDLPILPAPTAAADERHIPVLWRRWTVDREMPSAPTRPTLGSAIVALAILTLCVAALIGFAQVLTGQTKLHGIVLLGIPFVAFLFAGIGGACVLHIYALAARREDEEALQARFWHWWSDTVGGGILKLAIGAVLVVVGYLAIHGLVTALATSTGMIIALLFAILLVLCQIAVRLR